MDRHKRQNRKFFNNSEREHFLEKSNYVCSHCGKPLDVHTMTVEHALPIIAKVERTMIEILWLYVLSVTL